MATSFSAHLGNLPAVLTDLNAVRDRIRAIRSSGRTVGLVPTMGALHEGHLSLVVASTEQCDSTVVSIFVNPTQFGPGEDLDKYPRTLQQDLESLAAMGVDFVFAPGANDVYPAGCSTSIVPPDIANVLEGECRPGHFAGVCTVVLKLFQILPANVAFFGQKDFQQARVIQQMVVDFDVDIEIVVRPIVREADGLALSSRNRFLSGPERGTALALSRCLQQAAQMVAHGEGDAAAVMQVMRKVLLDAGVSKIDYAVLADPETLGLQEHVTRPAVALVAAQVGETRLIDNRLIR
jgi:pantoate--beta-alanine ligase